MLALVSEVSPQLPHIELSHPERAPIDAARRWALEVAPRLRSRQSSQIVPLRRLQAGMPRFPTRSANSVIVIL
jgi:hypothetical protein